MAGNVVELTDAAWQSEVLESSTPVLVDFWAPWCPPCRLLAPTIEKLANDYAGRVKIGKINTDENPETAANLGVSALPTVLIIQNGRVLDRLVGASPEGKYRDAISRLGVA